MDRLFYKFTKFFTSFIYNAFLFWLIGSCLLVIITGCTSKKKISKKPARLQLQFNQQLTIGGKQDTSKKYQLDNPTEVRTDSNGNIYVADAGASNIKVFDSSGHFRRTIGRSGKGPGEFNNISAISINRQDELVAFDAYNKRITIFSNSGSIVSSFVPSGKTMAWPFAVRQLTNNNYLLLTKPRNIPNLKNKEQRLLHSTMFHLYNSSFHYRSSFGGMNDLITKAGAGVVRLYISSWNPGHICLAANGGIWYAPGIYSGRIFRFQKDSHGWRLAKTITGLLFASQAVDTHYKSEGAWKVVTYGKTHSHTHSARINSEDLGLFTLKDGRLVNVTSQLHNGVRMTMVEVFNRRGKFEGFGRLQKLTFPGSVKGARVKSLWKDKNDRFYFIDERKVPVVRIGKIKGL